MGATVLFLSLGAATSSYGEGDDAKILKEIFDAWAQREASVESAMFEIRDHGSPTTAFYLPCDANR